MAIFVLLLATVHLVSAIRELPYITSYDVDGQPMYEITITSPEITADKSDQYFCFTRYLEELGEVYILQSDIKFNHEYVHHVSSSFCEDIEEFARGEPWECSTNRDKICLGGSTTGMSSSDFEKDKTGITKYPDGVSMKVGSLTNLKYANLEMHFKVPAKGAGLVNITWTFIKVPTRYNFQTEMLLTTGYIPANVPKGYFAEVACRWTKPEVQGFGVTMHTHHHGYMADFYRIRNGTWTLLASQLTQNGKHVTPVIGGFVDIKPGDILAAKCLYINTSDKPVHFGLSDGEEMCNADVLFGFDPQHEELFKRTGACVTDLPEFSFCKHKETAGVCAKTFS